MDSNACDSENSQLNEATALTTISNTNSDNVVGDDAISSTTSDKFIEQASSSSNCDAEADFLEAELKMSNVQNEKITENVEDIVQDLENLLGESTDSYRFETSRSESCTEINSTQEFQNDKLYENLQNELELHLSSQEVSSVLQVPNEVNAVTESQDVVVSISEKEVDESSECETVPRNLEVQDYISESVDHEVPEIIDSNTVEGVDNITSNSDISPQNASESVPECPKVSEIADTTDSNIPIAIDNEVSEAATDVLIVDSTEKVTEDAAQPDINEASMCQDDEQNPEGDNLVSVLQENENLDTLATENVVCETTEQMSIEDPIPDISLTLEPPSQDSENTELIQPLTVEVEELSSDNKKETPKEVITEENERAPIKMTITKTENIHSILKIYDPTESEQLNTIPELPVQEKSPSPKPHEEIIQEFKPLSPLKITIQNIRNDSPVCVSPSIKQSSETYSPKITIKPIVKPDHGESILKSVLEDKLTPLDHANTRKILQTHIERHSPKTASTSSELTSKDEKPVKLTIKPIVKGTEDQPYVQEKYSPKITIKPIIKPPDQCTDEERPARIVIKPIPKMEESEIHYEERHSPKITIKPIRKPEETHMTKITLKSLLYEEGDEPKPNPKITIKPIMKPSEETTNENQRKITVKPVVKPVDQDLYSEGRHSPKITIKPIPKPDFEDRHTKITIKPLSKSEMDSTEGRHSPKVTIKPIKPPEDIQICVDEHTSKLIIKPIHPVHRFEDLEERAPRITIKPVLKPTSDEYTNEPSSSPRITIKPIVKPHECYDTEDPPQGPFKLNIKPIPRPVDSSLSPKITIKPVPKQEPLPPMELIDFEDQIKQERIVLKIPKNRKNENERVNKIKVKLSKDQGIAQILPVKRLSTGVADSSESKYIKTEVGSDLSISVVSNPPEGGVSEASSSDKTMKKVDIEDDIGDPLSEIPVFEITLESAINAIPKTIPPPAITIPPAPRKRGRPRKVPLEVREDFKDPKEEKTIEVIESTRPKRSCRGPSVRATLGIRPRRPRGSSTRGRVGRPPGSKTRKDRRSYSRKAKDHLIPDFKDFDVKHGEFKPVPMPIDTVNNVVIYEEETRMSAENSSRAHTPAKQVLNEGIDESQSSIHSNTTTESGEKLQKIRKGSRFEVHQEPEGEVISADKLAEYSWGGGGPYMLQEQVAQFLGIKSFKRKYPGIQRRTVDMQERDFIRESCLASEAMCDMGLTAVKSEDILDIMYTDFQHKYEEYCKHQRDRQAKDVSNKQKALSLAASQEKNKLDIVEQAVQSALQWNASFNKARKEQRRACLDLQTFTVHFPKGKMKQINKPPLGLYPVALVPGQYSDYYKKYTPLELSKLPFNTVGRKIFSSAYQDTEDSQSDMSGSDSDSSSSDSDSSYSGSSIEDCKMCGPITPAAKKIAVH